MTLLEQARAIRRVRKRVKPISDEEIDLALAWLADEVSLKAVGSVMYPADPHDGNITTKVFCRLATVLREAHRQDKLRVPR